MNACTIRNTATLVFFSVPPTSADFDADFHSLKRHTRERWVGLLIAVRGGIPLPPVELIRVGNEYFVRDGHHRISTARATDQLEIEARIVN